MGAIINASIRVDKLPKEKFIKGKDGAVYYNLTVSVNDDTRYRIISKYYLHFILRGV